MYGTNTSKAMVSHPCIVNADVNRKAGKVCNMDIAQYGKFRNVSPGHLYNYYNSEIFVELLRAIWGSV